MEDPQTVSTPWPSFAEARDGPVLEAAHVLYRWRDVEALARHGGRWTPLEREVRTRLAAWRAAERSGGLPSADAVREAAADFRRERRLLAAEDMERWLHQRRLRIADWLDWVRRQLVADAPDGAANEPVDVDAALWVDGVCTGRLRAFSDELAGRAAVYARTASTSGASRIGPPTPEALDEAYERFRAEMLTADRVADTIREHRLDWMWVDAAVITLPTFDAAQEAAALLEDGVDVEEIGALANAPTAAVSARLANVSGELRLPLTAASPGATVGPVERPDGWTVARLRDRRPASPDDPDDLATARAALERRLVSLEVDRHIRWHDRV